MKKLDQFVNLYSVSKTLRFKAIPVGKTQENITAKRLLEEDEERAEKYKKAKKIIDRYHIAFIEESLSRVKLSGLDEYVILFNKKEKDEADKKKLKETEADLRKQIVDVFRADKSYELLFDKELIESVLPIWLNNDDEKSIICSFKGFKTAFEGFNENRKNMYTEEEKSTSIAYRCINENLPKFISNHNCFEKIRERLGEDIINTVTLEHELDSYRLEDLFAIGFFDFVLNNKGIAFYNEIIGGRTTEEGIKIKGLNEYINLYNQQLSKAEKGNRLPLLKTLYKQVLSEYEGNSFYIDGYQNVSEMMDDIKRTVGKESDVFNAVRKVATLFDGLENYNLSGLFIKNGISITDLSNGLTGDWNNFRFHWEKKYDEQNMKKNPKNMEKYEDSRRKAFNAIDSFSIQDIQEYLYTDEKNYSTGDIVDYYKNLLSSKIKEIGIAFEAALVTLSTEWKSEEQLSSKDIELIKSYLDALKDLEKTLKSFIGSQKEANRDEVFYGTLFELLDCIVAIDSLYNRVRNYVTKKPYSTDKYKLYFQNPQFLGGWDKNKVSDYRATLLRKDGKYYIVVIDKGNSKIFDAQQNCESKDYYEVLDYKLIPGASKQLPKVFFSKKGKDRFKPSKEVQQIYDEKSFTKGSPDFSKEKCHKLIDYYKQAIAEHEWNDVYHFNFSETSSYEDISGFYKEVDRQGYKLSFYNIEAKKIDEMVENGKIYLFQLYNKDFSTYSKGKENLHTMYFKQVFNDANNGEIKLCGGAELFFRKASIKKENRTIHPANQAIKNKNPLNQKETSVFEYDLIKDKRYTLDQYEIHIPITLNRNPEPMQKLNDEVRKVLRDDSNPYIIGIDRGERNLLYVCVIDGEGKIVEQYSLNEIVSEYNGNKIKTDYHALLSQKEYERDKARQDWGSIENIKELKEGYISQVVHKICTLVLKYDAVVAMEDLNSGFKNSRKKVEKQVYQKFEKALIDKFNYLTDKSTEVGQNGSVTKGYQIANAFQSFKTTGTQNGFIFYIPAWLTSKIDPVTGFADLIKPKYTNINEAKLLIRQIDKIQYNNVEDMFEFWIDYSKFPRTESDYKKKWIVYTNGTRIKTFRNPKKNNEWDNKEIVLTEAFKQLFNRNSIPFASENLREIICEQNDKQFYSDFIDLFKLTLQMRNSITGRTDVDYLISPVKGDNGDFYDSRNNIKSLPCDADANGAYNIARKVLWVIEQLKEADSDSVGKVKIAISNKEWMEFAQSREG